MEKNAEKCSRIAESIEEVLIFFYGSFTAVIETFTYVTTDPMLFTYHIFENKMLYRFKILKILNALIR